MKPKERYLKKKSRKLNDKRFSKFLVKNFSMFRRICFFVKEKKTDLYIDTNSDDKEYVLLFLHPNSVLFYT